MDEIVIAVFISLILLVICAKLLFYFLNQPPVKKYGPWSTPK